MNLLRYLILFTLSISFNTSLASLINTRTKQLVGHPIHYGPAISQGKPVTLFAHGLQQNQSIGYEFYHAQAAKNGFIEGPLVTFNFYDFENMRLSYLGQSGDVQILADVCSKYAEIDAVGDSRGAATFINYMGTKNPQNIKSAVVEAVFSHTDYVYSDAQGLYIAGSATSTTLQTAGKLSKAFEYHPTTGVMAAGLSLLSGYAATKSSNPVGFKFPLYNPYGLQPINVAHNISKEIPILFICSNKDTITHPNNSWRIFNSMKKAGHNKVVLLQLEHGEHAHILESQDGKVMRNVTHAFYRHFGRPFNQEWADAGQSRFEQCPGYIKS